MALTTLFGRTRANVEPVQICWGKVDIPGRTVASLSMWKTQGGEYEVRLSQGSSTDTLASVTDVATCYKLMLLVRSAIQLGARNYSKATAQLLCALHSHRENAANAQAFVSRDVFLRVSSMTLDNMPQEIQELARQ